MGPKPASKRGKDKKDGESGDNEDLLTPEEQIKMLVSTNRSLQMQLAQKQEETVKALSSKQELFSRLHELEKDFEDERKGTLEITQDMTRQYKSMQEELLNRINTHENTITEMKDQLEVARMILEETKKDKDEIISMKNAEIGAMNAKMEDMAQEFGEMLKETLEKMRERIEISNTSFDNENNVPMIRRLEEFSIGSSASPLKSSS